MQITLTEDAVNKLISAQWEIIDKLTKERDDLQETLDYAARNVFAIADNEGDYRIPAVIKLALDSRRSDND